MCSRSREARSRSRTSSSVSRDVSSVSEPSAVRTPLSPPALTETFRALLEADFTVLLRNNRALLLSFALPLVVLFALFASKFYIALGDPQFRVASVLTLGMASIAILGYAMTVARDREKGVFQRLRVTPAPTWTIMTSRLLVQVAAMLAMALVVLVAADLFKGVSLTAGAYLLTFICVIFSSALFLGVGQAPAVSGALPDQLHPGPPLSEKLLEHLHVGRGLEPIGGFTRRHPRPHSVQRGGCTID